MYPSITGFELDMEDKSLIKQILECFLQLTADPWEERSWSRFAAYCKFVKGLGKLNLGQELHGNRFGDFGKCCTTGIYSIEMWVDFIIVRGEARNDLAIFLRDTQHRKDICILLWLCLALLGIHLKELIEKKKLNGAISFIVDRSKSNTTRSTRSVAKTLQ